MLFTDILKFCLYSYVQICKVWFLQKTEFADWEKLIHSTSPKSRAAGRDNCFHTCCPSVLPSPLFKSKKTKQQKNNVRYWRDYGSGRVDNWWHLSCEVIMLLNMETGKSRNPECRETSKCGLLCLSKKGVLVIYYYCCCYYICSFKIGFL